MGFLNAIEKATAGLDRRIEGVPNGSDLASTSDVTVIDGGGCRSSRYQCETDRLAVRICAVELANRRVGIVDGCIRHESSTRGATGAVETKGESRYGTYPVEEALKRLLAKNEGMR